MENSKLELTKLLSTPEGIQQLTEGGKDFMFSVNTYAEHNILDFGSIINYDDLESYSHSDYAEDEYKYISQPFELSYLSDSPPFFELISYEVLPKQNINNIYTTIEDENGHDAVQFKIHSHSHEKLLYVKINVNNTFEGPFNHWLLLTFEGSNKINAVMSQSFSFIVAIRVVGTIAPKAANNASGVNSQLSSDAKPFISRIAYEYFDTPVINIYIHMLQLQ
jgi:hypothetical protein